MSNENNKKEQRYGIDPSVFEEVVTTNDDNKAFVVGVLKSNLEINYISSVMKEVYYRTIISVVRKSGEKDSIRVMIPRRLLLEDEGKFVRGVGVRVVGTFCSHLHKEEGDTSRLRLYVLAQNIEICSCETTPEQNNIVYLKGKVKKPPFVKRTVAGKRITDLLVAVKRENHTKYDYIPCIMWGRSAYETEKLRVGDQIELVGRIQSRSYWERGKETKRVIHEVSVFGIMDITKQESD